MSSNPKDSLEENILIEYTINVKHEKLKGKTDIEQAEIYNKIIKSALRNINSVNELHYLEKCKDGIYHVHGKFQVIGRYIIEGVLNQFVRDALKQIDGRLKTKWDECYYPRYYRYRSPSLCVQYSDTLERKLYWDQYITKDLKIS